MATLTVNGGTVLAVNVLDSSSVGRGSPHVLHFRIAGGPPDVTLRASTGLAGDIDFLCDDVATANAVHAANDAGGVLHLDTTGDGPPVLNLDYVAQSADIPHFDRQLGRWIVRARGVQEVAV